MAWIGQGSILNLPTQTITTFAVPTPPTPSATSKPHYAPNLTAGPTGKCPYRPWVSAVVDGLLLFANGWDPLWYWDEGSNFADVGSAVPTTGAGADDTAGSTFPAGTFLTYYLVWRNSVTAEESAPQQIKDVTDASLTFDVDLTWTDPAIAKFDKALWYRRLQNSDNYKLIATVAIATETYTDQDLDAAIETNTAYVRRFRETKPPTPIGVVGHGGRAWIWEAGGQTLYYSQFVDTGGELLAFDFPSPNLLQIGVNDGYGEITAVRPHYTSLFVFKRRAIYEVIGDDPGNFVVRRLFADRGAISQRAVLEIEGTILFVDEQGLYSWVPGAEPLIAGATVGTRDSPLASIWERMNLDIADTFFAYHDEENGLYVVWIALDHELEPGDAVLYDYRRNRFLMDDARWGTTGGWLEDAAGKQHLCRIDNLGYLWEDDQSNAEGVFSGTKAGTMSGGTALTLTDSGAAFDLTTADGVVGCPVDIYDTNGVVLAVNRVASAEVTVLTNVYAETPATVAAQTSYSIGVIPAEFKSGKMNFASDGKVHVTRFIVEHDIETSATLRFDAAPDDQTLASKLEMDLSAAEGRQVVDVDDRGWDWTWRGVMRQAGEDFSIHAISIEFFERADRT